MNKWFMRTSTIIIGIGVSVSVTAVLIRLLLRKEEEEEVENVSELSHTVRQIKVPKRAVGVVIGRGGTTIKELQQKTNTKINVDRSDEENVDRIATIRGSLEDVQEAENLINKLITDQPEILTEEIFVPVKACGRIIGRNGDNIRHICRTSKAKVNVTHTADEKDPKTLQRVIIKGSRDQIDMAISMIDEKLAEEEVHNQKVKVGVAGRPLPEQKMLLNSNNIKNIGQEKLVPTSNDGYLEVFVSAVESPGHFWVQLVGTKSTQLDKMGEEMTEFYKEPGNQNNFSVTNVSVGEVVAALYHHDSCWYRAYVMSKVKDDSCPEGKAEILFVDFGDTDVVDLNCICKLKPEYMVIPFQAIECCLASAAPVNDKWSKEATEAFEKLSYSAQWKSVMVKAVSFIKKDNARSDTALVELIDTCGPTNINIAEELVNRGYAVMNEQPNTENVK